MDKSDININIKTVICYNCKKEQPKIRIPKSWKEFLWGGYTCKHCECKMDKYGAERK